MINNIQKCKCIYCEKELIFKCFEPDFCIPCKIEIEICEICGTPYRKEIGNCPKCRIEKNFSERKKGKEIL